jgi:cytochrome c oxidase cbb3-type subunit IV
MLKYIKQHMESIEGISIYPIISLLIFFIFCITFCVCISHAKSKIEEISAYPLSDDQPSTNTEKTQQ